MKIIKPKYSYRIPPFKRPWGALHFAKKICKKTSYYFINFCLEKINFGAWRGALIRGGGLNQGYTVHIDGFGGIRNIPMVSVSPWSCSTMCSSSSALSERSALSRITRLYLSCIAQHNMLSRYTDKSSPRQKGGKLIGEILSRAMTV